MELKSYQPAPNVWMLLLAVVLVFFGSGVNADTLDDILKRKKIVIGVSKVEDSLSEIDNTTGKLNEFEQYLARDLARRLGVGLEIVPLSLSQRENALIKKKVDVLIASMIDSEELRKTLAPVLPHYYRSGVSLLSRKVNNIQYWKDLRNQRVCSEQGAYYNRLLMVRFGFDVIPLYSRELALAALFDGRCVGLLYLDSPAIGPLQQTKWGQDFLVPLDILRIPPWSVYLNIHDKDSRLEKWISKTVIDWHREGLILDLEKKWGLPNAIFSIQMNQLWNKKINNKFFCTTPISDQTPRECVE